MGTPLHKSVPASGLRTKGPKAKDRPGIARTYITFQNFSGVFGESLRTLSPDLADPVVDACDRRNTNVRHHFRPGTHRDRDAGNASGGKRQGLPARRISFRPQQLYRGLYRRPTKASPNRDWLRGQRAISPSSGGRCSRGVGSGTAQGRTQSGRAQLHARATNARAARWRWSVHPSLARRGRTLRWDCPTATRQSLSAPTSLIGQNTPIDSAVECRLAPPIARKPPFRFRPDPVVWRLAEGPTLGPVTQSAALATRP